MAQTNGFIGKLSQAATTGWNSLCLAFTVLTGYTPRYTGLQNLARRPTIKLYGGGPPDSSQRYGSRDGERKPSPKATQGSGRNQKASRGRNAGRKRDSNERDRKASRSRSPKRGGGKNRSLDNKRTREEDSTDKQGKVMLHSFPTEYSTEDIYAEVHRGYQDRNVDPPLSVKIQNKDIALFFKNNTDASQFLLSMGKNMMLFGESYSLSMESDSQKRVRTTPSQSLWVTSSLMPNCDIKDFIHSFGVVNAIYRIDDGFVAHFRHEGSGLLLQALPQKRRHFVAGKEDVSIQLSTKIPSSVVVDSELIQVPYTTRHAATTTIRCSGDFVTNSTRKEVEECLRKYFFSGTRPTLVEIEGSTDLNIVFLIYRRC